MKSFDEISSIVKLNIDYLAQRDQWSVDMRNYFVIGLSGGTDSSVLLFILDDVVKRWSLNIKLVPVYVNHEIRPDVSRDISCCKSLCNRLGLDLQIESTNVPQYAKEHKLSIEDGARIKRYEIFRRIGRKVSKADLVEKFYIVTGHHMDDQAETILLHLLRGTGLKGLEGMKVVCDDVFRPLLSVTKQALEQVSIDYDIHVSLDETNASVEYSRNRVRHELLPELSQHYNENIVQTLFNLSELAQEENDYMELECKKHFEQYVLYRISGEVRLRKEFFKEPLAMSRRLIRMSIQWVKGDLKNITKQHVDQIIQLETLQSGRTLHIQSDVYVKKEQDCIRFFDPNVQKETGFAYSLDSLGNKGYIQEVKLAFSVKLLDYRDYIKYKDLFKNKSNNYTKCFDYDTIKANLVLRSRQTGDYIHINRNGQTQSIKKYMIDNKIPARHRYHIPLLVDGCTVMWIVGYRTNPLYEVTESTKRVMVVELNKEDNNGSKD